MLKIVLGREEFNHVSVIRIQEGLCSCTVARRLLNLAGNDAMFVYKNENSLRLGFFGWL